MNSNKFNKSFLLKTICFVFLLLIISCSALPERTFALHKFSSLFNTKEFSAYESTNLPPVVLFDPILLKESALFRIEEKSERGLIPFLNQAGFTVYLISSNVENLDYKTQANEIDNLLNQVAAKHKSRDVILGGLSLGGQVILEYMAIPKSLNNYAIVKKIFFIGTGIDYNYTNSFMEKSKQLGYENNLVENLCKINKKDNFCTRYVWFNNELQEVDNSKKDSYLHKVPKLSSNYISKFHPSKVQLPYFFLYGKLDSISPEESIYPFFHKIRPTEPKGDSLNTFFEAGEANGHSIDYDHADLFVYEKAEKEIYRKLKYWLKK